MSLIHRAGDTMIFRQNTSTPGGTVWPIAAHSIAQNFPITIVAHVTVSITGANQALFSLGTAAARMLEVGVDGTGQPYAWGSGAQVILGAALTAGSHVLAFIVSEGGTVSLLADIDYFGLGTVAMGTAVSRACAGVSCLGTLPWAGTYSDLRVYASDDEEAAAGAMGLVGRASWTPYEISTLHADWDAEKGIVEDAGDVASWTDQKGGRVASTATLGARPTKMTDGGIVVVDFDGNDQIDINTAISGHAIGHMFAIVKAIAGTGRGFHHFGTGIANVYPFSDGLVYDGFASNARKEAMASGIDLFSLHCFDVLSKSARYTASWAGVVGHTTATNTVAWNASQFLGNSAGCKARIARLLVFNAEITGAELIRLRGYLRAKYGVTIA